MAPESLPHLQSQRGAVDIPEVALWGLGLQDLLLHSLEGQVDPVSLLGVSILLSKYCSQGLAKVEVTSASLTIALGCGNC